MSDIQKAMRRLYALPSRGLPEGLTEPEKADIRRAEVENIMSALRGVTAYALSEAVERIMQNALGHKWMPLPPELRGLCDQIMKPILNAQRADFDIHRHAERQRQEREASKKIHDSWTPESRARATAKWEATKAQQRLDNAAEETRRDQYDTSTDACMARLKAAAEANSADFNLDKIKNAPSDTFKQAGRAA
ncbi:hypothetical protein [Ochrobactrum sp. S1502_03]|uniref:hypothetical protein n=1 Tax=Ochrobactrum sp. S1502_03 TaxID=3108451 RepID=UPI0037C5DCF2